MMTMQFELADKKDWNGLTERSPYASPFHEFEWGEVVAEQFNASFLPIVAQGGQKQWLVPAYTGLSWQGKGDIQCGLIGYGGPLPIFEVEAGVDESRFARGILEALKAAKNARCMRAVLYPAIFWNGTNLEENSNSTSRVVLDGSREEIFSGTITGNVRTAIRKAQKNGVTVQEVDPNDDEALLEALALLRATQQNVGSAYQTEHSLFKTINALQGKQFEGRTIIAKLGAKTIGMAYYVSNPNELFHLFHGWDRQYANLCANQLLIWSMIERAINLDIPIFNMGESHTTELLHAKKRWGAHTEIVPRISLPA